MISGILNDYDYSTQDVYKVAIVNGSTREIYTTSIFILMIDGTISRDIKQ